MNILENLRFVMGRLEKLRDDDRVRYEGMPVFEEARQELASAIAGYVPPSAALAATAPIMLTVEQLAEVVASVRNNAQEYEITVLGAIAQSQDDVIAALKPPIGARLLAPLPEVAAVAISTSAAE